MSRTKKKKRPIGYEYWGKRPFSRDGGASPGKVIKQLTHRVERLEGRKAARDALKGRDDE